jgi:single-strand DNA-binding protein
MIDLNRATILGRLTRDPELRTTPSGQSVTTIGIATNRSWTDSSGTKQERVEYHNVVMWGKLAEIASQYLSKGRRVYVEGRLQTRDWTGQDGVKRYRTEIIAENMIMLDGGGQRNAPNGDGSQIPTIEYGGDTGPSKTKDEIKVEDIPF